MPLRARMGQDDILAFEYNEKSWNELKKNYKSLLLIMPCCQAKAIPKTSKLGTFFFYHSVKGGCTSEAESPEHEYVKAIVAKSAKDAGWSVKTEWWGKSPSGERWCADVMCFKGEHLKIAFEIQLSPQSVKETQYRQERYKASGVRCAWFVSESSLGKRHFIPSEDIPLFIISKPKVDVIPIIQIFNENIDIFVEAMLSRKVAWKKEPWVYALSYLEDVCWNCNKLNKQFVGYSIDVYGEHFQTMAHASSVLKNARKIVSNDSLTSLGLNTIGRFDVINGKKTDYPYCNVCIHCGAPQNNYQIVKKREASSLHGESITEGCVEYISDKDFSGEWNYKKV
jgi:hypothetical protein